MAEQSDRELLDRTARLLRERLRDPKQSYGRTVPNAAVAGMRDREATSELIRSVPLVGQMPPVPETLRGRIGAVGVKLVQRVLFWYSAQIQAFQRLVCDALREQASVSEQLRHETAALQQALIETQHQRDSLRQELAQAKRQFQQELAFATSQFQQELALATSQFQQELALAGGHFGNELATLNGKMELLAREHLPQHRSERDCAELVPSRLAPAASEHGDGVPRLLAVHEICRDVVAVVAWSAPESLVEMAAPVPVLLASRLRTIEGELLVADGPRGTRGPGGYTALKLPIPAETGRYRLEVDAVAEGRFWASDRGVPPVTLEAERLPDGAVVIEGWGARRIVRATPRPFAIPGAWYGYGDSERCIEIPWVLSRYQQERTVLDVGFANAEERYLAARDSLGIEFLVGIDIAAISQSGVAPVLADVRRPGMRPGFCDLVLAVSVLEHIGRDNTIYRDSARDASEQGDFEAVRALVELLKPGGRILITVPFGAAENRGWLVQYDLMRLHALIEASGCFARTVEFYRRDEQGWSGPCDPEVLAGTSYRTLDASAGAVACIELVRVEAAESL